MSAAPSEGRPWLYVSERVTESKGGEVAAYALVEHVRLVPQGGVLAQVLANHLHPLHLQPLQLLSENSGETAGLVHPAALAAALLHI